MSYICPICNKQLVFNEEYLNERSLICPTETESYNTADTAHLIIYFKDNKMYAYDIMIDYLDYKYAIYSNIGLNNQIARYSMDEKLDLAKLPYKDITNFSLEELENYLTSILCFL